MVKKILLSIIIPAVIFYGCKKGVYTSSNQLQLQDKTPVFLELFLGKENEWKLTQNNRDVVFLNNQAYLSPGNQPFQLVSKSSNKAVFEGAFTIKPGADTLVFFQPSSAVDPIFMRKLEKTEPKPAEPFMKLKLANLAPDSLGKEPIDVIIEQIDRFKSNAVLKRDTIYNVQPAFPEQYRLIGFVRDSRNLYAPGTFKFVKSATKEPIVAKSATFLTYVQATSSVVTGYLGIDVGTENGVTVYKLSFKTLLKY